MKLLLIEDDADAAERTLAELHRFGFDAGHAREDGISDRKRQERELERRADQQTFVANLGNAALRGESIAALVEQISVAISTLLEADICATLQEIDGRFRLIGGNGWAETLDVDATAAPMAVYTIETAAPVIVSNFAAEIRFEAPQLLLEKGAVSGITIPVSTGRGAAWGIIGAHFFQQRELTVHEVEFLRAVATVLAQAIERDRADQQLILYAAQQTAIAEQSRAAEERYREVVEGASEVIFTLSPDGLFLSLNAAFEQITGWPAAEWLGRSCFDLVERSDADRARILFRDMLQQTQADVLRINGKHGDVLLDITSFPKVESGRTRTIYGFARDITERRKLEAQLEQAHRLTSLGRMAATIAHEFNNVLMGISPFVEVIRRGKSVETSLDHIGRAVKRGKRVTEEILRFTRHAAPQRAAFEVESWVENIALEARSLVPPACRIETFVHAAGLVIDGDANQLQQIFTNLILNARDAMPQGGRLTIEMRRERATARWSFGVIEHPERFVHCIVSDTGCGMSAETLRHIYEPLFTTKKSGTGLGLAVAHQVVQRHGGEIFVESALDAGTTFHIFLPLAAPSVMAHEARTPAVNNVLAIHRRHVLLVEDDPAVAIGLVSLLEMEGLYVDVVETGAAAIRALDSVTPDLVVLDVGLPDMEGTNVYEAIAAKLPHLPVIFSTGHADRGRLDAVLEHANVAYLLKPYESNVLLRTIEDVLGHRQRPNDAAA
jgi:two-component system cell cycle sensor histidine kinase/response regulator CckA